MRKYPCDVKALSTEGLWATFSPQDLKVLIDQRSYISSSNPSLGYNLIFWYQGDPYKISLPNLYGTGWPNPCTATRCPTPKISPVRAKQLQERARIIFKDPKARVLETTSEEHFLVILTAETSEVKKRLFEANQGALFAYL